MESIENLKIGGLRLIQDDHHLKLGVDAILLAAFARPKKRERACDLGCGNGVVSLLLLARASGISIDAVDIDEGACDLSRRNATLNGLEGSMRVHNRDLKDLSGFGGNYTLVVSNPPYRRMGSGKMPEGEARRRALFEIDCDINDVTRAASRLLQTGGRFCAVYPAERLADLLCAMREVDIEPKRAAFARHTARHLPTIVLVEGIKDAGPGMKFVQTLTLKNPKGEETARYKQIYGGGRL